jgi:hypothetical protein
MLLTNGRIYTLDARGTIADTLPRRAKTSSTSAGAPRCPGSWARMAT